MASSSKTQFLSEIHSLLARRYKLGARDRLPVLDAVVYGICHEGTTREQANQALNRFRDQFFDWNEVRVSSARELYKIYKLRVLPIPTNRPRSRSPLPATRTCVGGLSRRCRGTVNTNCACSRSSDSDSTETADVSARKSDSVKSGFGSSPSRRAPRKRTSI
jgi:hypothetical protein